MQKSRSPSAKDPELSKVFSLKCSINQNVASYACFACCQEYTFSSVSLIPAKLNLISCKFSSGLSEVLCDVNCEFILTSEFSSVSPDKTFAVDWALLSIFHRLFSPPYLKSTLFLVHLVYVPPCLCSAMKRMSHHYATSPQCQPAVGH